jgi:hypothetical protein
MLCFHCIYRNNQFTLINTIHNLFFPQLSEFSLYKPLWFLTSSSLLDSSSSPFFLHNGDSLGAVLVSQPLIGENYNT